MTEKELNSLYWLTKRIKKLEERIHEISLEPSAKMNGMPHSPSPSNPVQNIVERRDKLITEYIRAKSEAYGTETKIRQYIGSVEDEEVKLIMEMRFLYMMSWFDIGEELNLDRTTAAKKMRKYLNEH